MVQGRGLPDRPGQASLPGPGATASLGGRGQMSLALKAARAAGGPLTTMTPRNLPLAMGLALCCLLVLPQDAWARHKLGGFQNLSPSDPQVEKVVQVAMADYNKGSNSLYYFRDTNILKAQRQLLAGFKYYLTVEMQSTICPKNKVDGNTTDVTHCPLATGVQQEKLHCNFVVLVVSWKNISYLQKHNCVHMESPVEQPEGAGGRG
ncbi:cystatin-M [Manis pentadactyla]|uniref:cystatin-M n=1 Tax=Manis pentadactyla TaxID=143292 RepID=UPI00255C991F|nr:cystatin-M [Manis pentadactyla]KAI5278021.1 Cystatin-M [Manis pentadactyla]